MDIEVNEEIHLEEHNPYWQLYYQREFMDIRRVLTKIVSNDNFFVEHIGSTSIPQIVAKPIIDILIGVCDFPPNELFLDELTRLGYIFMKNASVTERLYLIKRKEKISYNIHIVEYQGKIWNYDIKFRDYFLLHPEKAKEYSELKEKIFKNGATTLLEYSAQKADFIAQILREL